MSFGKMNGFADIVKTKQTRDSEGFTHSEDEVLASGRVYREGRHGMKRWMKRIIWRALSSSFMMTMPIASPIT